MKAPAGLARHARVVRDMLELGDQRLLASDGPAGGQLPVLSADEWGKVYRACKAIAADRPLVVCLCGSSRFVDRMAVLAWNFEKEGHIALGLHLLPRWYTQYEDHQAEHEGIAEQMDALHLRKIDMADEVFVVNVDGYIGDSTRREIAYATAQGKPVRYLVSTELST